MVLPGARGPRQGCGAGAAQHPAGRGPGAAPCPHTGEGAAASGHISSQLCSQPFPPELPRTRASPAGRGQSRAKDACREHGWHAGKRPASRPAGAASAALGTEQMWEEVEAAHRGGPGQRHAWLMEPARGAHRCLRSRGGAGAEVWQCPQPRAPAPHSFPG